MNHREASLNKEIKKVTSRLLAGIDFPKAQLVTITRAEISSDLKDVNIFVSVFPFEKSKETLEKIRNKKNSLKKKAAQRIEIKNFPEFHFKKEEKNEAADRINRVLNKIDS